MRKRQRKRFDHGEPIAKIDTRPLAFVAMFLAIVFLMPAAQVKPHSFHIDLWDGETAHPLIAGSAHKNARNDQIVDQITLAHSDALHWNGEPVSNEELAALLSKVRSLPSPRITEFLPDGEVSYDRAVKVLHIIQKSGVTFRIAGMEEHCHLRSNIPSPVRIPSTNRLMRTGAYRGWLYFPDEIEWNLESQTKCTPRYAVDDGP